MLVQHQSSLPPFTYAWRSNAQCFHPSKYSGEPFILFLFNIISFRIHCGFWKWRRIVIVIIVLIVIVIVVVIIIVVVIVIVIIIGIDVIVIVILSPTGYSSTATTKLPTMISVNSSSHRTNGIQRKLLCRGHTLRNSQHKNHKRYTNLHVVGCVLATAFSHKANIHNRSAKAARNNLQLQQHGGDDRLQGLWRPQPSDRSEELLRCGRLYSRTSHRRRAGQEHH